MPPVLRRIFWLAPLLLVSSLAGCSDDPSEIARCEARPLPEEGKSKVTIRVGGMDREFLLFVPSGYDGSRPHALMLVFHGAGPSPDARPRSELEFDVIWNEPSFALPDDMVVAAPRARAYGWTTRGGDSGDIEFAEEVLNHVEDHLCIDAGRLYASGISSGGMLVSNLACRLSERLAAVGTSIGVADPFASCVGHPSPLPIVSVVGSDDGPVTAVAEVHRSWARNNGCEMEPSTRLTASNVTTTEYRRCTDGATVTFHVVHGMGHQQARRSCANIPELVRDNVCFEGDFDMRSTQLQFFAAHTRSSAQG